jgi:TetR/AcrR family transcriptional regulator, regulator of cefoperazone and chloramphenicol sensitivity
MSPKSVRFRPERDSSAEQAETRLIQAGVELFSRYSFDGVSTRMLADRAHVNWASIQYYFGSKEGLYHAVARHVVEQVWVWFRPATAQIEKSLEVDSLSPDHCISLLCTLLDHSINGLLDSAEARKWLGIIIREQMEPTAAFDILYGGLISPAHKCFRSLLARIFCLNPDAQEIKLRAYAIAGLVLPFHVFFSDVCRTLNWEGYGFDEVEAVRSVVIDHLRAILGTAKACP